MMMIYQVYELVIAYVVLTDYCTAIRNIPASLGSTVTLPCQSDEETGVIGWEYVYQNGSIQTYSGMEYIVQGGISQELRHRLRITGNHSTGEYNLEISDLRRSDEGNYNCKRVFKTLQEILLYILEAPSEMVLPETINNTIPGLEDQELTISCTAIGGRPPPEVKLTGKDDHYIYKTGIQSLTHTFTKVNRSFDLMMMVCQANSPALYSPLTREAQIYLDLKPGIPSFNYDPIATENLGPLSVSCTSVGSRPASIISWKISQTIITSHSTQQVLYIPSTDTYTVVSTLTYTVDRSHNGQTLTCGAVNKAAPSGVQTSKIVNVTFAPDVSVSNMSYSQNDIVRTITCIAVGNPSSYIYSWVHKSKYGVVIREWKNLHTAILTLPVIPVERRYQDTGEYVCKVSNGVRDSQGNIIQNTGKGYVRVNASPVFTQDNNQTQHGEFGKRTDIHVHVYSVPKYTRVTWVKGDTVVSMLSKYAISETTIIVSDVFHNKAVDMDGYRLTLTINDLQEDDFTTFLVQLSNMVGQSVTHTVKLAYIGRPETPLNFSVSGSSSTSITVRWIPGYNGGFRQTVYIQFRIEHSDTWTSIQAVTDQIGQTNNGKHFYTVYNLQPGTAYEIRMYSSNVRNQSDPTLIETAGTIDDEKRELTNSMIVGIVGGVTAVIVILIIGIAAFKRHRVRKNKEILRSKSEQCNFEMKEENTNEYEEIENKDLSAQDEHIRRSRDLQAKIYETLGTTDKGNFYDDLKMTDLNNSNQSKQIEI